MRIATILVAALSVILSVTASGQSNTSLSVAQFQPASVSTGCPVLLFAHPQAIGETLSIDTPGEAALPHAGDHGVQVQLTAPSGSPLLAATVQLWGLTPHGRLLLTGEPADGEVSREFNLRRSAQHTELVSDLWMGGVAALVRLEVTELVYADGSVWRPSSTSRCTVVPGGVEPIDARP